MTAGLTMATLADALRKIKAALDEQAAQDAGYRPLVICHPDQEDELRAIVDREDLPVHVQANRWGPPAGTIYVITALGREHAEAFTPLDWSWHA